MPLDIRRTTNWPQTSHSVNTSAHQIAIRLIEHKILTGIEVVYGVPSDPGCKSLVEPQLRPPVHRDKISEPLVCKLYGEL